MEYFGIIGYPLSHSFSPGYFAQKFSKLGITAEYKAYPLEKIDQFPQLLKEHHFKGINVTIPYKEKVIPYLDELDEVASRIGAVNTIKIENGNIKGYNTDAHGFEMSLMDLIDQPKAVKGALILGTGGAAKAVEYVLNKLNIPFHYVSRNPTKGLTYDQLSENVFKNANLIINTTPLGMYPKVDQKPEIPYQWIDENYFLYDLVYNPEKTLFLTEGLQRNAKIKNGYDMLILQAEKAWNIWNQTY